MKNKVVWIVLGAVVLLAMWGFGLYNSLIGKTTAIDGQWAQVETQYQRRFDLIPNLVSSTQGLMKQEQQVFKDIADARTRYAGATTVNEKAAGATQVESALGRLLVIMENYPQLKSDQTVLRLMDELSGTENRISVERRRFNEIVGDYNVTIKMVPANLLAGIMGFTPRAFFEAVGGAEKAPEVKL